MTGACMERTLGQAPTVCWPFPAWSSSARAQHAPPSRSGQDEGIDELENNQDLTRDRNIRRYVPSCKSRKRKFVVSQGGVILPARFLLPWQ